MNYYIIANWIIFLQIQNQKYLDHLQLLKEGIQYSIITIKFLNHFNKRVSYQIENQVKYVKKSALTIQ